MNRRTFQRRSWLHCRERHAHEQHPQTPRHIVAASSVRSIHATSMTSQRIGRDLNRRSVAAAAD
jgi:hypothetical protein